MKQSKRKNSTAQPYVDEWDEILYDELLRDVCTVLVQTAKTSSEYRGYIEKKEQKIDKYDRLKNQVAESKEPKARRNREGMFGLITNAINSTDFGDDVELSANQLYARLRRMHDNRTAFRLVDLHEIFLCLGKTPDALFKLKSTTSVIEFLTAEDIEKLEQKEMCKPFSMIVCCVPLLGLSLVVNIKPGREKQNSLSYTIIDSLEIFLNSSKDNEDPKQITPPIPRESSFSGGDKTKNEFYSAYAFFCKCITLAKGIIFDRNGEKLDYSDTLLGTDPEKYCLVFETYEQLLQRDSFNTTNGLFETAVREFSAEKQAKEAEQERVDNRPDRAYKKSKKAALDISTREARQRSSTQKRQSHFDIDR